MMHENLIEVLIMSALVALNLRHRILREFPRYYDQFLLSEQVTTKRSYFVYKIRESLTLPKQELAYNSKSSNEAQKLPTYSH